MALIACPECSRSVSNKAVNCPGCGCPVRKPVFFGSTGIVFNSRRWWYAGSILILCILLVAVGVHRLQWNTRSSAEANIGNRPANPIGESDTASNKPEESKTSESVRVPTRDGISEVRMITERYSPFRPGMTLEYDCTNIVKDPIFSTRAFSTEKDVYTEIHAVDGSICAKYSGFPERVKRVRKSGLIIEVKYKYGGMDYWEPLLKIGAKEGDSWNNQVFSCTVESIGIGPEKNEAVIECRFGAARRIRYKYVEGVGLEFKEIRNAHTGELIQSMRLKSIQPTQ